MSTVLEFDAGLAKLKLDLSEFASAIKDLAEAAIGAKEKEDARAAIKAMIEEARRSCDTIVRIVSPLYAVTTAQQLTDLFGPTYPAFKAAYLTSGANAARTHCKIVAELLGKLKHRRNWMKNLPLANHAFQRLNEICSGWLLSDQVIVSQLEGLFAALNKLMDEIHDLNQTNPQSSLETLRDALRQAEGNFLEIQRQLGELEALGEKL